MTLLNRWTAWRAQPSIAQQLARLAQKVEHMENTLDDIRDNQAKEKALIEKLLGLVTSAPAGTFTPEQQLEIDQIVADQQATLAEDTTEKKAE